MTILFIAHDLAVVRGICDRVGVMQHGEMVELGPVADIFDRPKHEYTRNLIAAVPNNAATFRSRQPDPNYKRGDNALQLCMMIPPTEDRRWTVARPDGGASCDCQVGTGTDRQERRHGITTHSHPRWRDTKPAVSRLSDWKVISSTCHAIKLGLPGRDDDIARYCDMLSHMGRLGIGLLCFNFIGVFWLVQNRNRHSRTRRGAGQRF